MECPHLEDSARITAHSIKCENNPHVFCCSVCKVESSPWICLACGVINCGRYVNAHAKQHHEEMCTDAQLTTEADPLAGTTKHAVCMDCHNYMAFCYICDDFVINDTESGYLKNLRKHLESISQLACHSQSAQIHRKERSRRRDSSESIENVKKKMKKDEKSQRPHRSSGLRNLGNTCFMNAVVQSLSNIQEFCGYIKQLPSLEDKVLKRKTHHTTKKRDMVSGETVLLIEELRKTLVSLWQGQKAAISPESLFNVIWKVVPRFRGYQQQDAHEFMRYLLDRLHTELLQLLPYPNNNSPFIGPKGKSTIVTAIFGGLLQNEVNCLICGMESKKHDPFLVPASLLNFVPCERKLSSKDPCGNNVCSCRKNVLKCVTACSDCRGERCNNAEDIIVDYQKEKHLSLDIPSQFSLKTTKAKEGEPVCTLVDCLSSFTDVEELEDSELYMCSNCKQKQKSTKKFWIRRLPNVLCLHLKRFRWGTYHRLKVETYVDFPLVGLDMSRYVLNNLHETRGSSAGSNLYDLAAVVVHHGSGAGSGHYTSYASHDGQWYHFNDSTVTCCEKETVAKCKGYILFYVRREIKLPEYLSINGNKN